MFRDRFPNHPDGFGYAAAMAAARGEYDEALVTLDDFYREHASLPTRESNIHNMRSAIAATRGRLRESAEWQRRRRMVDTDRRGLMTHEERAVRDQVDALTLATWFGVEPPDPDSLDQIWQRARELAAGEPEASLPWNTAIRLYIQIGAAGRARELLDEYRVVLTEEERDLRRIPLMELEAELALVEGNPEDAIRGFRAARNENTGLGRERSLTWWLATAYEAAGEVDSAATYYQAFVDFPLLFQVFQDSRLWAPALLRLGELREQQGHRDRAVELYSQFVDLWAEADSPLQPQVEDVRNRIARLTDERN